MQETPFISIIMPAFDAEKTIRDSAQSVLDQTYRDWELIIIDDGSPDGTGRAARSLAETDPRIRVFTNQVNQGVSESRNFGIRNARGEWIAFLDSDDLWTPVKLQKQVERIRTDPSADLVFTGSAFMNGQGERAEYILKVPQTVSYRELLRQNIISCSSVLVRRELMMRYPMGHDGMHEDYAVWLQILRDGGCARGIDEPLLIYRLSAGSKSGDKKRAALMTYRVYRYMGLGPIRSLFYFACYCFRSMKKYYNIRRTI